MTFLLDVNVLIALVDPAHVHHDRAHRWFDDAGRRSWATCPLTENGVIRIVSSSTYANSPGSPAAAARPVASLRRTQGHVFWADEISLLDERRVDLDRLLNSKHVTDSYLLALAKAKGGRLATFDRRLMTAAVADGAAALHVIPAL